MIPRKSERSFQEKRDRLAAQNEQIRPVESFLDRVSEDAWAAVMERLSIRIRKLIEERSTNLKAMTDIELRVNNSVEASLRELLGMREGLKRDLAAMQREHGKLLEELRERKRTSNRG